MRHATSQKTATPQKPERNDLPGFWLKNTATINDTTAIDHHEKKFSATADNNAINITDNKNFIKAI